jgi:hypothetical protein
MSFPAMTPLEVISLGDISISLARGHYQCASTDTGGHATRDKAEGKKEWYKGQTPNRRGYDLESFSAAATKGFAHSGVLRILAPSAILPYFFAPAGGGTTSDS